MFNDSKKLKEENETLNDRNLNLKSELQLLKLEESIRKETIKEQEKVIARSEAERLILCEVVYTAVDIMNEYEPITSKYHKMILEGSATIEDIKKCSNIVQNTNKLRLEFNKLIALFNKEQKEHGMFDKLNLTIVK